MQKKTINRIRENIEKIEENTLAKYAIKSKNATRLYMENYKPCTRRTEFERDKDRIIYSLAFKRLMEKTQVYMTNQGDHYTNRLSHTLEVTQISRSVASSLGLNQNLIEAISLGHDLGHTPFGHAVESILNKKLTEEGFAHNYQSVLVVDLLENKKIGEMTIESKTQNFFEVELGKYDNLITNPPWLLFSEAIKHAKKIIKNKIAMLLPIQFLTGKERYDILTEKEFPLTKVYVFNRLLLFSSELRDDDKINVGNIGVAWFIWENIEVKKVNPIIKFIDIDPFVARKGK